MKTRSEWTFDDWALFGYDLDHRFNILKCSCTLVLSSNSSNGNVYKACGHGNLDEAARLTVEYFCKEHGHDLPWRPDYDLSTVEGCKEAIKSCGYDNDFECGYPQIKLYKDASENSCIAFDNTVAYAPPLAQWQEAAKFAIDNPA